MERQPGTTPDSKPGDIIPAQEMRNIINAILDPSVDIAERVQQAISGKKTGDYLKDLALEVQTAKEIAERYPRIT